MTYFEMGSSKGLWLLRLVSPCGWEEVSKVVLTSGHAHSLSLNVWVQITLLTLLVSPTAFTWPPLLRPTGRLSVGDVEVSGLLARLTDLFLHLKADTGPSPVCAAASPCGFVLCVTVTA